MSSQPETPITLASLSGLRWPFQITREMLDEMDMLNKEKGLSHLAPYHLHDNFVDGIMSFRNKTRGVRPTKAFIGHRQNLALFKAEAENYLGTGNPPRSRRRYIDCEIYVVAEFDHLSFGL